MNRYKLRKADFPAAILYVQGKAKKGDSPNWAVKYKTDLTVHGKNLRYKGMTVIPAGDVDTYLRKEFFDKKSTVPFSRDAAFHVLKKRVAGIGRRSIMEFFRKQRTLGSTRPAVPKPKVQAGERLKKLTVETDLIFIRKADLVRSNPRFKKRDIKDETYIVSTVEKTSGLSRLSFTTTKKAAVVTPIVKRHIEEIASALGVSTKVMRLRMDKGGEFSVTELKKTVPDTTTVAMGSSVEARNRMAQQNFYRILKNRRALTIQGALRQTETLLNASLNRIQGKSPDESVSEKVSEKQLLAQYNRTRQTYEPGDKRLEFKKGDFVRILIKATKPGIEYKSYKGKTWTQAVFKIQKRTQGKRRGQPIKYRVEKVWYTQDKLLKSAPRDKVSDRLIEDRDEKEDIAEAERETKQREEEKEHEAALKIHRDELEKSGAKRRTRSGNRKRKRYRESDDDEFEEWMKRDAEVYAKELEQKKADKKNKADKKKADKKKADKKVIVDLTDSPPATPQKGGAIKTKPKRPRRRLVERKRVFNYKQIK